MKHKQHYLNMVNNFQRKSIVNIINQNNTNNTTQESTAVTVST